MPRAGRDWPQFRGIEASGIADGAETPVAWTVADGKGIAWKTAIPGLGLSSPVVWDKLVCVTTAISGKADAGIRPGLYGDIAPVEDDTAHEWRVICLDRATGKTAWQQTAHRGVPKIKRHTKATHANSTLATDGERLVAFFGSEGLYAYDMKGKLLWKKDLGVLDAGFFKAPEAQWETGSSPILRDGVVVVQADVQKGSFLAAFDAKTGAEKWRTARADVPTWGTPAVHVVDGRAQVVVNGWKHIGGYDLQTGREVWRMAGGGDIPVPTPVVHDGLVYITNAHGPAAPVYAIRADGEGRHHPRRGRDQQRARGLERRPRRRLHVHAARVPRPRLHREVQRRALRLRREDRRAEVPGAAGRRDGRPSPPPRWPPTARCTSPTRTARCWS